MLVWLLLLTVGNPTIPDKVPPDFGPEFTAEESEISDPPPDAEDRGRCFGANAKCSVISCSTSSKCIAMGCNSCR